MRKFWNFWFILVWNFEIFFFKWVHFFEKCLCVEPVDFLFGWYSLFNSTNDFGSLIMTCDCTVELFRDMICILLNIIINFVKIVKFWSLLGFLFLRLDFVALNFFLDLFF
jgi:hypothetical protein